MKTLTLLLALAATPAFAANQAGFGLDVTIAGVPATEYHDRGTIYIEALRGNSYELRITNPTGHRVAVALAVDGLNTINAKQTDARSAAKWVLDPYESTVIPGWQVSGSTARRFFFTNEQSSYGAAIGKTKNLGVIEAVFFRERVVAYAPAPPPQPEYSARDAAGAERREASASATAPPSTQKANREDYAATGIGRRERHDVTSVHIDLDPNPVASLRIRYEFRPQLVRLGVIPREPDALARRERARGFEYCPEP